MLKYLLDKQTIEAPHQGDKNEKPVSLETEDNRNISDTNFLTSYKDSAANTGTASIEEYCRTQGYNSSGNSNLYRLIMSGTTS
jgi:hypothetical protein